MYSSLMDAPINSELFLLEITNPALERWLQRLGLFVGATLIRHDREFRFFAVRARGSKGDVIIPAGLAMKVYVHIESGEKIPLPEMKKNHRGHLEMQVSSPHGLYYHCEQKRENQIIGRRGGKHLGALSRGTGNPVLFCQKTSGFSGDRNPGRAQTQGTLKNSWCCTGEYSNHRNHRTGIFPAWAC